MLEVVIYTVTCLVSLFGLLIYLYPGSAKPCTIPGLKPTTKENGNISDINRAGSLHEFLLALHKQFGSIVSFWIGKKYIVSISSPELFKEHQGVFDRPPFLFKMLEPLVGPKSIQFANKSDGRARRQLYDKTFSNDNIRRYYQTYQKLSDELVKRWSSLDYEEHIPLSVHMSAYALKFTLITIFALKKSTFLITKAVKHRRDNQPIQGQELLIDLVIKSSDGDDELINSDAISYVFAGFHTTGNLLTWGFYFLASHPDVQEKAFQEVIETLGDDELDHTNIDDLRYVRQILNETLRCAAVAPMAARFQDVDSELGGHRIPKNTSVIHALGVSLKDEKYWPLPNKFDPDRFSPENMKTRPPLTFKPFGFAGKRVCPGYRLAYSAATACLVTLLRHFNVKLVYDEVVTSNYGLVTRPKKEIWIKTEKR